jgi:hypothetical protein
MGRQLPELAEYGRFVRRHAVLLAVCALAGLASTIVWHAQVPPTYTATSAVLLNPVPTFAGTDPSGRAPRDVTIDTDAQLVRSSSTIAAVARAVGRDRRSVAASLQVSAPSLTRVLQISYTAADPATARAGAVAAGRSLISARREFLGALQPSQIARLQLEVARLDAELQELVAEQARLERRVDLEERVGVLRNRLTALYAARTEPGRVLRAPTLPSEPDPTDSEVPLTSGTMLGLLAGCGIGAVRDARQRRRWANSPSTSSPNRRTASSAPA